MKLYLVTLKRPVAVYAERTFEGEPYPVTAKAVIGRDAPVEAGVVVDPKRPKAWHVWVALTAAKAGDVPGEHQLGKVVNQWNYFRTEDGATRDTSMEKFNSVNNRTPAVLYLSDDNIDAVMEVEIK